MMVEDVHGLFVDDDDPDLTDIAHALPCTQCQAGPGELCRDTTGHRTIQPHAPRHDDAEAYR